jgi:hypothetical protein
MERMTARRRELAATDPSKLGGRPKKRVVPEPVALELEELRPRAIRVLEEQLDSSNEHIAQRAAIKILEYTDGRPTQKLVHEHDGIREIVYVTAALVPESEACRVLSLVPGVVDEFGGDCG